MNKLAETITRVALDEKCCAAVEEIYQQVDREMTALGVRCEQCGRCCHFADYGQDLMAGAVEVGRFLAWLIRQGQREVGVPLEVQDAGLKVCPFLEDKSCAARQGRILGCRVFFCRGAGIEKQQMENVYEVYHGWLKGLHEEYGLTYEYVPWGQALAALSFALRKMRKAGQESGAAGGPDESLRSRSPCQDDCYRKQSEDAAVR